ncbi:expressed protein [Dictyostelium purpureum]|uniref:Expressed protein n=1 Tax=Dictyostelium purpureum TaxID=5786 RepID=F0ZQV7_DICPU|nr:uncharacterized protein DICPUDRAFT_98492 [Dictyostelium purpureum]EGC33685.1 expressed protein [Dictyostelium purpureum]|eukprot:XP_003289804.1 expressed protein [Dictyostelium purpureum]
MKKELPLPDQSAFIESNYNKYKSYSPPRAPIKDYFKDNDIFCTNINNLNIDNIENNFNNNNINNSIIINNKIRNRSFVINSTSSMQNINNSNHNSNNNSNSAFDCADINVKPCDFLYELAKM